MKIHIILFMLAMVYISCEKRLRTTEVSGQVVDYGSGEPIEGVTIHLKDGWNGSGTFTDADYATDAESISFTDKDGKFTASLEGRFDVFLFPYKNDEYWPYDLGETAITNKANGYEKGSLTEGEVIILRAKAFMEGYVKNSIGVDSFNVYHLSKDLKPSGGNTFKTFIRNLTGCLQVEPPLVMTFTDTKLSSRERGFGMN